MNILDDYLGGLGHQERRSFERLAKFVKDIVPDAEQGKSYGMPVLKHKAKPIAGFLAAKDHLSYFPFSSGMVEKFADELKDFSTSKGTIRFTPDKPLPEELFKRMIKLRVEEIEAKGIVGRLL